MSDSLRLQFLKALTQILEQVSLDEGLTNLQDKVFRGLSVSGVDLDPPFLVINEDPEYLSTFADSNNSNSTWRLILNGAVDIGDTHPTDPAHNFLALVKKAIGLAKVDTDPMVRPTLDLINFDIEKLTVGGGVCYTSEKSTEEAYFMLDLNLKISDDLIYVI